MDRNAFSESLRHGNLAFDVMACSAIGGSSLALFFFFIDIIEGRGLFTPALLGAVLFEGADAQTFSDVSLSLVAGYTVVHFTTFAIIGLAASLVVHAADHAQDRSTVIILAILAIEIAFFSVVSLALPGAVAAIGTARIIVANVIAGASIGAYLLHFRRQLEWDPKQHSVASRPPTRL